MAIIRRYLAIDYPNTVLGTYATMQLAMNALPNPRNVEEIIEVECDDPLVPEIIGGFDYNNKGVTPAFLIIRVKEGHDITLNSANGSAGMIGIQTFNTANATYGNLEISDFKLLGDASGSDCIRIKGALSSGSGAWIENITFRNISGDMTNNNRVNIEHCDNINFINCHFQNSGTVLLLNADFNVITVKNVKLENCHLKIKSVTTDRVVNADGSMVGRIEFNDTVIEGGGGNGVRLRFVDEAYFKRCIVRDNGGVGIEVLGRSDSVVSNRLHVENCLLYNNKGGAIFVNQHFDNVSILQNTIIYEPNEVNLHAAISLSTVGDGVSILGNIISTDYRTNFATLRLMVRLYYRTGLTILNQKLDYNVFYRHNIEGNDINVRLYDISFVGDGANQYINLLDIQNEGYELHSIEEDPIFSDPEYNNIDWYEIHENSPARDNVLDEDLTEFDVRGWYRQELYQDAGCWDYDANQNEKPESDELLVGNIYRESDNTIYPSIFASIIDNSKQTKNETIIIRTEKPIDADTYGAVWYSGRRNTQGHILTIKAHPDLVFEGKRVKIGSLGGLCFNINDVENIVFENIHFEGDGDTDSYCFRIDQRGANNIIFKDCKFSNARNPFYCVIGNSIEFYDCEFTECTEYPVNIIQGDNIVFERCIFNYGSKNPIYSWTNRLLLRIVNVLRSEIRFCIFDEPKATQVGKYDGGMYQLWYGNSFKNIQWITHWFVPGLSRHTENVIFDSNVWEGNNTSGGNMILGQKVKDFTFINNTVKHTLKGGFDCIFLRDNHERVFIYNNLFEIDTDNTFARVGRFDMSDKEILTNLQSNNNVFNLNCVDNTKIGIYRIGDSVETIVMDTLSELQVEGLDSNSFEIRDTIFTSQIDNDYIPLSGSNLINNATIERVREELDYYGNLRDINPDIGAVEKDGLSPTPTTPTIDFDVLDRYEEPYVIDNYLDGLVIPKITPSLNPLGLSNKSDGYPINIYWKVVENLDPQNIDSIVIDSEYSDIVIDGNFLYSTIYVNEFTISGSTNNDGTYNSILSFYDDVLNKTTIRLLVVLDGLISDGVIFWSNVPAGGVGKTLNFTLDGAYTDYDLWVRVENDVGFDEVHVPLVWEVKTARPIVSFSLNKYIIFEGDTVSLLNQSVYGDSYEWRINTPSGLITEITENVSNVLYDTKGEYVVELDVTNVDGIKSTIIKSPAIFVEEIPSKPYIDFNSETQIVYTDQTVKLNSTIQGYTDAPYSRFLTGGESFVWEIIESKTGILVHTINGENPEFVWDTVNSGWGYFDVKLTVYNTKVWGGVKKIEKRFLTVLPTHVGKTTHDIGCNLTDTWVEDGESTIRDGSLINGINPNQTGALNATTITAGDVIKLSGTTRELRLYDLQGTEENPILIICDNLIQDKFEVITRGFSGIETHRCEWVIIAGKPNNSINEEFGIKISNDNNPATYNSIPGTSGIKIEKFSNNIHIIGVEIDFIKFAGVMVKTNPEINDPNTWRNVGDHRMLGVTIGHSKISNCLGEGIYSGYFTETIAGVGDAESGYEGVPYYAQVIGDHIIFRNEISNCGFDGIQVGCAYLGTNEIHNNDIINPGYLRTFGQNAAMSLNWIKGKIYNNRCEGHIISKGGVDGEQLIFNNVITSLRPLGVDAVYYLCDGVDLWDFSVSPPILLQNQTYGYGTSIVKIFNNLILTSRNAIVFNRRLGNEYVPKIDYVNNITLFSETGWGSGFVDDSSVINIIGGTTTITLPQTDSIIGGNIIRRVDNISDLKLHDINFSTIQNSLSSESTALTGGTNLSQHYDHTVLFDYNGYLFKDSTLDDSYHVGTMTWNPFYGKKKITNAFYGTQKILKIFTHEDFPTEVGDEYGGGKVAYFGNDGDFVNGMVSATSDQSTGIQWGCQGTTIGGDATGTAIGTGQKATAAIVAGCSTDSAAKLCDNLSLNGYTDWFLPSRNELNELYQNKDTIGGFSAAHYWSSSEFSSRNARLQNFDTGTINHGNKSIAIRVRGVRGFAINYTPQYIYEFVPLPEEIGEEYGGGIVAYLGSEGDFENGMISAAADTSTSYQWGCRGTTIGGDATGTAIGTGQKATAAIVAGCSTDSAAKLCDELSLNGYTDWFLPSINELNELYQNKDTIGGFSAAIYWSSSEGSSRYARIQLFSTGNFFNYGKFNATRVRGVRGF